VGEGVDGAGQQGVHLFFHPVAGLAVEVRDGL
jgi:hypothetical protein